MADADIAVVRIVPETSFKNKAYEALKEAILKMDIYATPEPVMLDERALSERLGVSRTPIWRVILEATVRRRIVRRRDDNAVGEMLLTIPVINENGSRDDWRWCEAVVSLDDRLHVVGRQYL